jgi:hypothetical protein
MMAKIAVFGCVRRRRATMLVPAVAGEIKVTCRITGDGAPGGLQLPPSVIFWEFADAIFSGRDCCGESVSALFVNSVFPIAVGPGGATARCKSMASITVAWSPQSRHPQRRGGGRRRGRRTERDLSHSMPADGSASRGKQGWGKSWMKQNWTMCQGAYEFRRSRA